MFVLVDFTVEVLCMLLLHRILNKWFNISMMREGAAIFIIENFIDFIRRCLFFFISFELFS